MAAARILKEPLVHFFALGILIFAAFAWTSRGGEAAGTILVTAGQQRNLIETFERTWNRPPSADEFNGLLEEHLREELAYREASLRELDRNDTVIRRRLRQKLELLAEDLATVAPPTEAELEASFAASAERYRTEARFSFDQVDFSSDRRGAQAEDDARALLVELRSVASSGPDGLIGDSRVLPPSLTGAGEREIAATFGVDFATSLANLPPGEWQGPLRSPFGWHLVRLSSREPGRIPSLADVVDRVRNDVLADRRSAALDLLYANLAERYEIRVEPLSALAETETETESEAEAGAAE